MKRILLFTTLLLAGCGDPTVAESPRPRVQTEYLGEIHAGAHLHRYKDGENTCYIVTHTYEFTTHLSCVGK